jgi:hypothetical protein
MSIKSAQKEKGRKENENISGTVYIISLFQRTIFRNFASKGAIYVPNPSLASIIIFL